MTQNMNDMDKGRLRKLALSRRAELSVSQREKAGEIIAERLLSHPAVQAARTIMCYRSCRSEIPTAKLIHALEKQGGTLCFPVCEQGGVMQAYQPLDESAWKKGQMGIMEPDRERSRLISPEDIDLVICPMVAFDKARRRMGYGGGYYDRYLPQCKRAIYVGLAFEAQRMERIPAYEHDLPMHLIVTEEKYY